VAFRCLLQDTGYPPEVYIPGDIEALSGSEIERTQLKERWVGWGVEIPGEQSWASNKHDNQLDSSSTPLGTRPLPVELHSKYPLPDRKREYLGALIKIYDDVSFKPASAYTFIGILSSSVMPAPVWTGSADDLIVPALHIVADGQLLYPSPPRPGRTIEYGERSSLISYLATAFEPPDLLAAEYLLLAMLASPSVRPPSMPPMGTLCVNFLRPAHSASTPRLRDIISSVCPVVVSLSLSLRLLHSTTFYPSSPDSVMLNAGLLQLAAGTLLIIDEDDMGTGGPLSETALKNLQSLSDCISQQTLRYDYPYMDSLKMDCAVRSIVLSEGKSLLPNDIQVPLTGRPSCTDHTAGPGDLGRYRTYLATCSSAAHAAHFSISDETAQIIQDQFVRDRRCAMSNPRSTIPNLHTIDRAEERLQRRMRVARLMALSHPDAILSTEVWNRTVAMDEQIEKRSAWYEEQSRRGVWRQPVEDGT